MFCSWSRSNDVTSAWFSTEIWRLSFANSCVSAHYVFSATVRWVMTFVFERFIFIILILIIARENRSPV